MLTLGGRDGREDAQQARNKVQPITSADSFFGKPDGMMEQVLERNNPTKCSAGVLAMRVPDPPSYAPPSICAISKDGKIVAVGGKDVELYLWSTDSGELMSTLRGHEIAWTSSNDNTFFVTVQEDSKVFIWDQQQLRQRQLLGHPDEPLTCCSVSLDDLYVVVGGARGTVYSWDSDSGVEYRQCEDGHTGPVSTVMCYPMPDGTHVIISCGAADHTIVVWDLETASKRNTILIDELEHAKNVRYHISKEGTQVAAWCTDSVPFPNLIFVDALNGAKNSVYCHDGLVRHATFAKDAAKIISCGSDGKIVLWDTLSFEPQVTLVGHNGSVLCCGINEEGNRIVSSGEDCTIRVWSTEDGQQLMMMQAQDEPIKFCAFAKSSSSNKVLSCDMSGRVYVWNVLSEVVASLIRRFADNISSVVLSNDNKLLAAGCNNGRIMMWDAEMRENVWEYSHHTGRVEALAFNSLNDLVATAGADGRVSIIAVDSGKQMNCFSGTEEPIMSICFSPDDEKVAGLSADGKLLVYVVASTSRTPRLTLQNSIARVTGFVWSPNSKLLAGCGSDGCVMVWNATTGSIFTVLEGDASATCCCFDVVGKLLAVGNVLGRTVLYNLESAEELCELRNNASSVVEVMFSQ
ncbi:quinon protein alcohol dehydrogenase-like superfamily, partial [Haematococcus lacustris]